MPTGISTAQLRQRKGRRGRPSSGSPSLLIGKLFDEHSEGLTPTHTKKGQRRYRYYVSRNLLKSAGTEGWRLAAAELETIVTAAAAKMLDDQRLLLQAAEQHQLDAAGISALLQSAQTRSAQIQAGSDPGEHLSAWVERVELRSESIVVTLKLPLPGEVDPSATFSISRELPLQMRRRGVEKRLLIGGEAVVARKVDHALLKAVARGYCWLDDFLSGRAPSLTAIGAYEKVSKRYISRVIRLGLLAPTIVDAIAEGIQEVELTAQSLLTRRSELPLGWQAQKQELGLENGLLHSRKVMQA